MGVITMPTAVISVTAAILARIDRCTGRLPLSRLEPMSGASFFTMKAERAKGTASRPLQASRSARCVRHRSIRRRLIITIQVDERFSANPGLAEGLSVAIAAR